MVNKRLTTKVRKLEKNGTERDIGTCKNATSKGKEEANMSMKKVEVLINEKEMLLKKLCESKKTFEVREERLKTEISRKEAIISKLHAEKNLARKEAQVEEARKKKEANIVEGLKKENSVLKKETKDLINENNKLKEEMKGLEIECKRSESERKEVNEEIKRLKDEKAGFEKLASKQNDETEIWKQKFDAYKKDMSNENILLKNEKELLSSKVESMKTSRTELNLTAEMPVKKLKKKRKFKFFCF